MPTTLTTSPGSYYWRHVKPADTNSHTALDGINSNTIPSTACRIAATSWLLATEYNDGVITVWIKASKLQQPKGAYYGMRIANVDSHHVGGLHAGNIPQPVTKRQLSTPTPIREAKAVSLAQAHHVKAQREARAKRGIVDG